MESGLRAPDPPESGGLIVMVRVDPAAAARVLANDLHAELAIGGSATEEALDRLAIRQEAEPTPPPDLDALAAAMRRAETIREQTRRLAAEHLAASFNTRLAIHPDTVRRAAAELISARAEARAAQLAVARRARTVRRIAELGAAAVAAGAAGLAFVAGPVAGLAVIGVAALGGAGIAVAFGALDRRRAHRRSLLAEGHQRAIELAQRRWVQVTGIGADPADAEQLIHRYEPQHRLVADLVGERPAVRAADQLAVERRGAWVAAWRAAVGDNTQLPDPRLAEVLQRESTELWLEAAADPHEGAETLVVASPYADLSDERARDLHRRLLDVPRGHRVIVVLQPDPDAPSGARLPGVGWVPAVAGA